MNFETRSTGIKRPRPTKPFVEYRLREPDTISMYVVEQRFVMEARLAVDFHSTDNPEELMHKKRGAKDSLHAFMYKEIIPYLEELKRETYGTDFYEIVQDMEAAIFRQKENM